MLGAPRPGSAFPRKPGTGLRRRSRGSAGESPNRGELQPPGRGPGRASLGPAAASVHPASSGHRAYCDAASFPARPTRFLDVLIAFCYLRVRLFVQDEARFGLHEGITRRSITAASVKPHQRVLPRYEHTWLFGATEPASGESLFFEMPALDSACFQAFLDEFSLACPDTMNVLVIDGAPAHVAHSLVIPDNVVLFRLPPCRPGLNPMERVWQDMRKRLSIDLPAGLDALVSDMTRVVREYTPAVLESLTAYPYLCRNPAVPSTVPKSSGGHHHQPW